MTDDQPALHESTFPAAPDRTGISQNPLLLSCWLTFLLLNGCATSPFSDSVKQAAQQQPSFTAIVTNPKAYQGRMVILGGEILQTKNLPQFTEIEVLQKPLNRYTRPQDVDLSHGRFLTRCPGYLDPAIYDKGREISIAGEVKNQETRSIDQVDYNYPVIGCREIHLWPIVMPTYYYPPGGYGYSPWGGWPGYYYPYWGYYPYW
jgi:outer membrane lipoprotein